MTTKLIDLSLTERLQLVEDLWESIAAEQSKLPIPEAQRRLLDERLSQFELDDDPGDPAERVLDRIRLRL